MSQKEKIYEEVAEGKEICEKLCQKYPAELWAVRTEIVTVLGVKNKERPEKSTKLAVCIPIKGIHKSLMQLNNINTRYVIELYWSDWNKWNQAQKTALIFHELLHIDHEIGKTVKHDVEDFRLMVDKLGVDWFNDSKLPNLLDDKVEFDLSMRANVPEDGNMEVDTGDEIMDKKEEAVEEEGEEDEEGEDDKDDGELF